MHFLAHFFFFPVFGSGIVIYFLPTIVAAARSKRDLLSIFLLSWLDRYRLDCRASLGGENRRAACLAAESLLKRV